MNEGLRPPPLPSLGHSWHEDTRAGSLPNDDTMAALDSGGGVMVGPLVRASLKAATTANRQVRVYAVEKNPNAVVTLRNLGKMRDLQR